MMAALGTCTVGDIALTRSGDKGGNANVGVWTRTDEAYQILIDQLTEKVVARHFARICRGPVIRYELPNLRALNFVLHDALDGGGSASLRTDAQGKVYGTAISLIPLTLPEGLSIEEIR